MRTPRLLAGTLLGTALVGAVLAPAPASAATWLDGDTHVHTDHSSDGSAPRQLTDQRGPGSTSVATQIGAAERRGLDFLPLTDHRTYDQHWDPQWTSSRLLLVPGEEANGSPHATVIGAVDQVTDGAEPPGSPGYRHIQQSIWDVHAQDASWGTAHPDDGETNADGTPNANASAVGIDTVEVLNTESFDKKLAYVENRWNAGYRFGVVAASDSHFSELDAVQGPGLPTTRVLAADASERALLDGLRAGHTTLSLRPDGGVTVLLEADTDGDGTADALGGDERLVPAGTPATLRVRVVGGTGHEVRVLRSPGGTTAPLAVIRQVLPDQTHTVPVVVPPGDSWYRVEVRGVGGTAGIAQNPSTIDRSATPHVVDQLLAATSPVFLSTERLAEPRAELPLPATTGADGAEPALGTRGTFTGFPDVAEGRGAAHLVAERHEAGRTTVVYRRLPGASGSPAAGTEVDLVPASRASRFPRVAAHGDDVWVTWQDERSGQRPRRPDVYLRHSPDGGRTWLPEQRLTAGAARAERPTVALLPDGTPVVAWMDNRDGAFDVFAQVVGRDPAAVAVSRPGKTTSAGTPTDSRSPRYPASLFPALAVAPDGRVSVVWQDNRFDVDPLFTGRATTIDGAAADGTAPDDWAVLVASRPPGGAWGAPVDAGTDPMAADRHPTAVYDDAGALHVAWDTKALKAAGANVSLRATRSGDGGATFGPAVAVALEPTAMSQRPRLTLDPAGAPRVVWYDTRATDWRWKVLTAVREGGGWGDAEQLSGVGNGTWPAVSGRTLAFTTDRNARVQRDSTQQVYVLRVAGAAGGDGRGQGGETPLLSLVLLTAAVGLVRVRRRAA